MAENWKSDTIAVRGGYEPQATEANVVPIVQSTTFRYDSAEHMAALFDLDSADPMYSRIGNPTVAAFENKIAQLEGGVAALATSSGQAATTLSIMNICPAGFHLVAASTLYGGTYALLSNTLPKMGVEVTFVDPEATATEIKAAFRPNTRAIFAETIGNPGLNILDFSKWGTLAKEMDVPLIIDNTFAPILCKPLDLGAHIVIHSATKYIDGHATSVGGVIIDGGNFNWDNGKYPELVEPDQSYHGLQFVEKFGPAAYAVKARVQWMRDIGPCMAPMNGWMMSNGLETLHLRMERHCSNALKVAQHLQDHSQVEWVNYPGLESHPTHDLAKKYLPKGCSGVLTFGVKGGREAGVRFMEGLEMISMVVHVADARTCVLHPASTTHRQLSDEQQIAAGVQPELIRLSVGIEHIDDILADIDQALAR